MIATMNSKLPAHAALALAVAVSACASVDLRGQGITSRTVAEPPRIKASQAPAPEPASESTESELDATNADVGRFVEAQEGDTPELIAARYGVDLEEFKSLNYLSAGVPIQRGRVLELPQKDETPDASRITEIASQAIGSAPSASSADSAGEAMRRPYANQVVHIVGSEESAYSIAADYGISVRVLAEWNALEPPDFQVRVNQRLLIPQGLPASIDDADPAAAASVTPAEETAAELPVRPSSAASPPPDRPASAQDAEQTEQSVSSVAELSVASPKFIMPVDGEIVLGYSSAPGGNEGIDISAPAGTPVAAAGDGEVSIVSPRENNTVIMLIRHPQNFHTVYTNLTDVALEKGDKVSKGQMIGRISGEGKNVLHFEVRIGTRAEDPVPYLSDSGS